MNPTINNKHSFQIPINIHQTYILFLRAIFNNYQITNIIQYIFPDNNTMKLV